MRNPYEEQESAQEAEAQAKAVEWFRRNYEELAESVQYAEESYGEMYAEHRSETAMFGDSWPGAQLQLRRLRDGIDSGRRKLGKMEANPLYRDAFPEAYERRRKAQVGYLIETMPAGL